MFYIYFEHLFNLKLLCIFNHLFLFPFYQVTPNNVDIAKVAPTYHLYSPAEVEAVIARL